MERQCGGKIDFWSKDKSTELHIFLVYRFAHDYKKKKVKLFSARNFSQKIFINTFFFSEENYLVVDYCPRNLVQLGEVESTEGIVPGKYQLIVIHKT